MLSVLYIIISFLLGFGIILSLKPYWASRIKSIFKDSTIVNSTFLFLPAAYLIGTLILSWITYFLAVAFRASGNPLLYANAFSFLLAAAILTAFVLSNRSQFRKWVYEIKKYGITLHFSGMEWFILLTSSVFWSLFLFRSLYMEGDMLHAGYSAFSDFGAHLPLIRSFSVGQNFPAQYPHFPDGTIRYHFMFYFMAGNLEYLGLNLPWALNLPSILSLVSFNMLLYGLGVGISKKRMVGFFTCLFFFFRNSFAFFTYSSGFHSVRDFLDALGHNLDASGNYREHIGNTTNESWGLWAQKVYVNQRHLAFAFGIMVIVILLLLPIFIKTVKTVKSLTRYTTSNKKNTPVIYFKEAFLTPDAWLPQSIPSCIIAGVLLGLLAFWNGAIVIASLSVLLLMATLSKHKLEYLVTATITFFLSTLQSRLFVGSGTGAVSFRYHPGFLAESGKLSDIASYFIELLGIFPFIILGIFLLSIAHKNRWVGYLSALLFIIPLLVFIPSIHLVWGIFIIILCLSFLLYITLKIPVKLKTSSILLIPVFSAPLFLATTLQLTPDITVNHKYIIMAVLLLNIPISELLVSFLETRKIAALSLTLCITFVSISTGLVDMITLYNLDRHSVSYNENEPLRIWTLEQTHPKDIFLTHYATHYGAPMSILLSGRMVYHGYPYFTVTAGYDTQNREANMKKIYEAENAEQLRALALSEGIRYIVVEEQNRTATEYTLNEDLFYKTFPVAFNDPEKNIVVFSVW